MPGDAGAQAPTGLVERGTALAELDRRLAAAVTGRGGLVWITGEAGVGKSALVATFVDACDPAIRVLSGICDALSTPVPLGPVRDMARTATDVSALLDGGAGPQLYAGFLDLLSTPGRPTIVVIEDVHWADEATLDLVRYVGRRAGSSHALLLATYQPEALGAVHPLRELVGDLATVDATERMRLAPLSLDGVARMATNHGLAPDELHRRTGGNPFYLAEVLANPSETIPATIRDAVLARHARLPDGARLVLETVAVAPRSMATWLIDHAVDAEPADIDACVASGLLVERNPGELTFRHELARLAVLDVLAPGRRAMLHTAVCDSLLAAGGDRADPARIAHHAGEAGDGTTVLRYGVLAARRATALGAHREAVAHYRRALEHAELCSLPELANLLEAHAQELWTLGHTPEALEAAERAVAVRRRLGDTRRLCGALRILSRSRWLAGQLEPAHEAIVEAVTVGEQIPPTPELAEATAHHAGVRMLAMSLDDAIRLGTRAVALAEQVDPHASLARALDILGASEILRGDLADGRAHLERSIEISRRDGVDTAAAHAMVNLGSCQAGVRAYADAAPHLARTVSFCAERDLDADRYYALVWQARAAFEQGHWAEAGDLATQVPLDRPGLPPFITTVGMTVLGRLRARRGDPGAAEGLDRAWDAAVAMGDPWRLWWAAAARGEAALLAGRREAVPELVADTFNHVVAAGHPWAIGELALLLARAGAPARELPPVAQPYRAHLEGDVVAAAGEWARLGCPYEQADALSDGDADQQRTALQIFDDLGAAAAAEALRRRMRAAGVRRVPRGPRAATAAHPAGLTRRQAEVLELVAGGFTNREIGEQLSISTKTAGHHVSAILAKLEVASREGAAEWHREHAPSPYGDC